MDSVINRFVGSTKFCVSTVTLGAYGVVVSMFDFHCSDQGSNPGRGGKIS